MRNGARLSVLALVLASFVAHGSGQEADPKPALGEADRLYAEGSYALALDRYRRLLEAPGSPESKRWLAFRVADSTWRAKPDSGEAFKAEKALVELAKLPERPEERDRLWAEIQEALGDFWAHRMWQNVQQAGKYYDAALDWWAGAPATEEARARYLGIAWRRSDPVGTGASPYRGQATVSLDLARNVLRLARTDLEKARAHGLVAGALSTGGGPPQIDRIREEYEAALALGRADAWYGPTLLAYAGWLTRSGRIVTNGTGGPSIEPDYPKAVEQYRRYQKDFPPKGTAQQADEVQRTIDEIVKPVVDAAVTNTYLPGSEIEVRLTYRNVAEIVFALQALPLDRLSLEGRKRERGDFLSSLDRSSLPVVRSWTKKTGDTGRHERGNDLVRLEPGLAPGAYVLTARSAAGEDVDLLLVTDAAVVLKQTAKRSVVWVVDAVSGAPLGDARVRIFTTQAVAGEDVVRWTSRDARSNAEGLAVVDWSVPVGEVVVLASKGDRTAHAAAGRAGAPGKGTWRVFAFADRAAYRPKDTVSFKVIARVFDGTVSETPFGRKLSYSINGPKGELASKGILELNAFGSGWASFDLPANSALGEYRISLIPEEEGSFRSYSETIPVIFRVEEYKLPEFRVSVETPMQEGRRKVFRAGDRVEAVVRASRYSGGAVAGAAVEVLVRMKGYSFRWDDPGFLSWYENPRPYQEPGMPGLVVERLTARTGTDGTAIVSFETKKDSYQELEYDVEARVVDSSRREVVSSSRVRVGRQLFYARLKASRNVCRPGEPVDLRVETRDANEEAVPGVGVLTVTRQVWDEAWLDPRGRAWRGAELRELQESLPNGVVHGVPGWKVLSRDYKSEVLVTGRVGTGPDGVLTVPFVPATEGYFQLTFTPDGGGAPSQSGLWATRSETTSLDYQVPYTGIEIISDKAGYRPGDRARVLVVARSGNRWLLFTTEGAAVESTRVLRMEGDVALLEIPIDERLTPNANVTATSIRQGRILQATKEILVPPIQHFLDLAVTPSSEGARPGEELSLDVTATDHQGKPVRAEVGVAIVDDSISYVQKDVSGDPRSFFHGRKRGISVQTTSSMQYRQYVRQSIGPDGKLEDSALAALRGSVAPAPPKVADWGADGGTLYPAGWTASQRAEQALMLERNDYSGAARLTVSGEAPLVGGKAVSDPAIHVRTDFRATAFWQPDVTTGADGRATVKVRLPESLTTWKATARAASMGDQYGLGTGSFRSSLPLMVRLEAPRFFVSGDTATISAVLENGTAAPMTVRPRLEAEGLELAEGGSGAPVLVPANGDARVDWKVTARAPRNVLLRVSARGETHRDAMERTVPVHEHGIEKLLTASGKLTGAEASIVLTLPAERRDARMTVQIEPNLAGAMLGALPYLLDYPYGCVEQTMSRFLPAVVVRKTLTDLGLSERAVGTRVLARAAPVDEAGAPRERKAPGELDRIVKAGIARLEDMQEKDGSWGWWKGHPSDPYMTAYVVWGLSLARRAGAPVKDEVLGRGAEALGELLENEDQGLELQAWILNALAQVPFDLRHGSAPGVQEAFERLWLRRTSLGPASVALLALTAHQLGHRAEALTLARNLKNGVRKGQSDVSVIAPKASGPGNTASTTAHWGQDKGFRWWESRVEATSLVLRALVAIVPDDELIEPAASWLAANRRAGRFSNTRDTAMAVLALSELLASKARGGSAIDVAYELEVNGTAVASRKLSGPEALLEDGLVEIDPAVLRDGRNEVRVRRTAGKGPVWILGSVRLFSLEEPIPAAGSGLFATRRYFRMKPVQSLLKGTLFEREELADGASVSSGDRIETIITLETKNDYEYLLVEDLKPAGFEAVQLRSGESMMAHELNRDAVDRKRPRGEPGEGLNAKDAALTTRADTTQRQQPVHQELRDRTVALFLGRLPQGVWEIRYDLRAEAPGRFHALPVVAQAMYAPDLRGNGDELRLTVEERGNDERHAPR